MATTAVDIVVKVAGGNKLDRLTKRVTAADRKLDELSKSSLTASNNVRKIGRSAASSANGVRSFTAAIGRLAIAYGTLRAAQQTIQAGIGRVESERRIKFLAKEYGEVERLQNAATRSAEKFGQSQTEANRAIADTYARLRPVGVGLEDIVSIYNGFNTAAKLSGANAVESSNAFRQLSQALGSGALRGDEFNSIAEQVPGVLTAISKETGIAQGKLRKYAAEGKITADVVIAALKRIEREGADQLAKALGGPEQAIKDLQNAGEDLQVAFAETIVPDIAESFKELAKLIKTLEGPLRLISGGVSNTFKEARLFLQAAKGEGDAINTLRAGKLPFFGAPGANKQLENFFGKGRFQQLKDDARKAAEVQGIAYSEALKRRLTAALKVIDATPEIKKRIESQIKAAKETVPKAIVDQPKLKGSATQELLRRIRSGEGNYTSVNRGRAGDTPGGLPSLTSMSIAEVMQRQMKDLFAVGAYQFIPETLKGAVQRSGIDPSERFSPANQDKLAIELILGGSKRPVLSAYLTGEGGTLDQAQTAISNEWAALLGPSGKGAYDGDSAGNMGSIDVRDLLPLVREEVMGGKAGDDLFASQFEAKKKANDERKDAIKLEKEQFDNSLKLLSTSEAALDVAQTSSEFAKLKAKLAADELAIAQEFAPLIGQSLSDEEKANLMAAERNTLLKRRLEYERELSTLAQDAGYSMGQGLAGMMDKQKEQASELDKLYKGIGNTIQTGIIDAIDAGITALIDGTKDLDDALKEIASGVLRDIGRQLISFGVNSALGGIGLPGFADGGRPQVGQLSIIGENGPELFKADTPGTIIPNEQMSAALSRYSRSENGPNAVNADGSMGGGEANRSIDVSYSVTEVNSQRYVTEDQFKKGIKAAAESGAAGGFSLTMSRLKNNRSTRSKLGM